MIWLKELAVCTLPGCTADSVHYHRVSKKGEWNKKAIPCPYNIHDYHYASGEDTECLRPRLPEPSSIDTTEATVAVLAPSPWRR